MKVVAGADIAFDVGDFGAASLSGCGRVLRRQPKDSQHMSKDFDDVYRAERSRGSRRQEKAETIAQKRLKREIVNMILNPGITRRGYQAILRELVAQP